MRTFCTTPHNLDLRQENGGTQVQVINWTEDTMRVLRALWNEGKSAAEIATILGDGATRSAVMGKLYRLGLLGVRRADSAVWNGRAPCRGAAASPPRRFSWEQAA